MISSHDHGNCELCDKIETSLAEVVRWNHAVAVCKEHTTTIVNYEGCAICDVLELTTWQENAGQLLEQALARLEIKDSYYADELRAALSVFHS